MTNRNKSPWDEDMHARYVAQNRGKGARENYKPWLTIHDFSSRGTEHRIPSILVPGKTAELFSNHEERMFYLADCSHKVCDIREQFPLDRDTTRTIANQMGVMHPAHPQTKVDIVMTTDFVMTMKGSNQLIAIDVKEGNELEDTRVLEKLEIARRYWKKINCNWRIVTPEQVPEILLKNLLWIRSGLLGKPTPERFEGDYAEIRTAVEKGLIYQKTAPLSQACKAIESAHGLPPGTALNVAKVMVHQRALLPDFFNSQIPSQVVSGMLTMGGDESREAA